MSDEQTMDEPFSVTMSGREWRQVVRELQNQISHWERMPSTVFDKHGHGASGRELVGIIVESIQAAGGTVPDHVVAGFMSDSNREYWQWQNERNLHYRLEDDEAVFLVGGLVADLVSALPDGGASLNIPHRPSVASRIERLGKLLGSGVVRTADVSIEGRGDG